MIDFANLKQSTWKKEVFGDARQIEQGGYRHSRQSSSLLLEWTVIYLNLWPGGGNANAAVITLGFWSTIGRKLKLNVSSCIYQHTGSYSFTLHYGILTTDTPCSIEPYMLRHGRSSREAWIATDSAELAMQ